MDEFPSDGLFIVRHRQPYELALVTATNQQKYGVSRLQVFGGGLKRSGTAHALLVHHQNDVALLETGTGSHLSGDIADLDTVARLEP